MRFGVVVLVLMNILRLVAAEKEKKSRPNPEYQKLEKQAACNSKDKGEAPVKFDRGDLRKKLSPMEYHVTQERGTERPFSGKFLRMKEDGVYTCMVCDNPLFRSEQKYESGCGWPSFHDVMAQGKVTLTKDTSHGMVRTEVTCSHCGAHLGHIFDDGPPPTFLRYCINSVSLRFVPREEAEKMGMMADLAGRCSAEGEREEGLYGSNENANLRTTEDGDDDEKGVDVEEKDSAFADVVEGRKEAREEVMP